MTKSSQACLICGSENSSVRYTATDHFVSNESFAVVECMVCGFNYTHNFPSADSIGPYYKSDDYISHSDTQKGLVNKAYHTVRKIMLSRKYRLIKRLTDGKKLLDIGCGTGYFPAYMKSKFYDVSGMEMDAGARNFAKAHFNVDVFDPPTMLNEKHSREFDIITLWHVLEHLHEPVDYINWIKDSLKDDGVLIIAIPNCNSFDAGIYGKYWAAYDVPRHLWHFTPDTFQAFISQFGLSLVSLRRMPFDAYYNALLSARYAKKAIPLLNGVFAGMISNFISIFNHKKSSSIIYIVKKAG